MTKEQMICAAASAATRLLTSAVRREFWSGVPMAVATWSLGGLYLALAPAIVQQAFGLSGTGISGLAIGLLPTGGAGRAVGSRRPRCRP